MALVRTFKEKEPRRLSLHDEVEASISSFEVDGRALLQIDTYGRPDREIPGKTSQTIQFDKEGAEQLYKLLQRTFNL
ncbi:methionyl-tRNA formyltransferase [Martelella mediterranea]|uniref:methionyl-tRNA formyltransferase n=1 Tax=Martelella mediterranea TaxID=293089 RepID=UPI001E5AC0EF|nr:methionyl-tRNA formyltransferase [Martelella mediterranea]MCD1632829.1 methionyl-tRNA formyltransferase [Martelella mediterranea]